MEDSLGRVACLPSLPMASMLFSTLSIIKVPPTIPLVTPPPQAQFDLNIYPLVREYELCCTTYRLSLHLLLRWPSPLPMLIHSPSPPYSQCNGVLTLP